MEFRPTRKIFFYPELLEFLEVLLTDHSSAVQVRASVICNHVVEGVLALVICYSWLTIFIGRCYSRRAGIGLPNRR